MFIEPYRHKVQHGFRLAHSNVLQLLVMLRENYHGLENNLAADAVLRFQLSFRPSLSWNLLNNMHELGNERLLRLSHSYLSDRPQKIHINGSMAPEIEVEMGCHRVLFQAL